MKSNTAVTQLCTLMLSLSFAAFSPAFAIIAGHSGPTNEDAKSGDSGPQEVVCTAIEANPEAALNPQDRSWASIPATRLPLYEQSLVKPYGGGATSDIEFKVARLENGIAVRLEWLDRTKDDSASTGAFKDGVAVEFPVRNASGSSLAMGHEGSPVNIWHWSADRERTQRKFKPDSLKQEETAASSAEDLVAAGYYNKTAKPQQRLQAHGEWSGGRWSVVIYKPFDAKDDATPNFDVGADLPVAIAVWNGGAGERLGLKSVSSWAVIHNH